MKGNQRRPSHLNPSQSTVIFRLLLPPLEPFNLPSCPGSQLLGDNDFPRPFKAGMSGSKAEPRGLPASRALAPGLWEVDSALASRRPAVGLWMWLSTFSSVLALVSKWRKCSSSVCVCRKGTVSACVTGKSRSWGGFSQTWSQQFRWQLFHKYWPRAYFGWRVLLGIEDMTENKADSF